MRHIFLVFWLISFWSLFIAAAQSSANDDSIILSRDDKSAILVYTPNLGQVELRYLDWQNDVATDEAVILPPYDETDERLLHLSVSPLKQHKDFAKVESNLNWILTEDGAAVFGWTRLKPGYYGLLHYDARPEITGMSEDRSVCWRDQSRVLVIRVRPRKSYYLDSMETHLVHLMRTRPEGFIELQKSVRMFGKLWPQTLLGFRYFEHFEPIGGMWFLPDLSNPERLCAIEPAFQHEGTGRNKFVLPEPWLPTLTE